MLPLHSGHSEYESALIVALAVILVAGAFALTREGWSRVGGLLGVATLAGGARVAIEATGMTGIAHLLGHGIEVGIVALVALAGYYAIDVRARTSADA
jgi:hypothetical protein